MVYIATTACGLIIRQKNVNIQYLLSGGVFLFACLCRRIIIITMMIKTTTPPTPLAAMIMTGKLSVRVTGIVN